MLLIKIVLVAGLFAWLGRGRCDGAAAAVERLLGTRWAPLVVGIAWAAVVWWAWGRLRPIPMRHDELAYLFQARLFAEGRWTAPAPPMADFFAQPHILVSPVMAAKYPPGHSLLLAIGDWFGIPVLVVVALAMVRGATAFALARRLSTGTTALVTTLLLLYGDSLRWAGSWFSQTTTAALLLVGWYALLRWHQGGARRWLMLLALSLGWIAITRPFSAVLFALPIAVVVLRDVVRRRRWRDLALAVAVGTAVVAIIPLWSWRTTGNATLWPVTQYTRDYMPYDHPHFGVDAGVPRRELPVDLAAIDPRLRYEERLHTVAALPAIATERGKNFLNVTWPAPMFSAVLALAGLAAAPVAVWVGAATTGLVFVGYLAHPTWADWTIYYTEVGAVLVFLSVLGLAWLLRAVAREATGQRAAGAPTIGMLVAGALCAALIVAPDVRLAREMNRSDMRYQARFRSALAGLPGPAVLFVRHASFHSPHFSLITNGPDWERAPVWVVPDRGDRRNATFLLAARGRKGFLFDENRSMIDPYAPPVRP